MKKNDTRFLMKSIHGLVDLSKLKPTEMENIFDSTDVELFEQYVWFNGFDYIAINPFLLGAFGIGSEVDKQILELVTPNGFDSDAMNSHKNRIKTMVEENRWVDAFSSIEKKIGLTILIKEFDNIPDDQKYDCFVEIYQRSEFGFEILKDYYKKIFSFAHLSEERKERISELRKKFGKEEFTIYHGVSYDFPVYDYYSWTLKEDTASFFAHRYSQYGQILENNITVIDAVDYLTSRNEEEILFSPSDRFLELIFKVAGKE